VTDSKDTDGADVGSLAEEATKLMGALAGWAKEHGVEAGHGLSGLAGEVRNDVDEHLATGAPECTYCPLCRTVHAVRQVSPEVKTHLASAASSLMLAAAGLLATVAPDDGRTGAARDGVEKIDLDEGDWPEEDS
jgi:hypothetical protein